MAEQRSIEHVVIVGGGADLAQPVIEHFCCLGAQVTALCKGRLPRMGHRNLEVYTGADDQLWLGWSQARREMPIDVLVTMTGHTEDARIENMLPEQWERVMDGTLDCVFRALQHGLPLLAERQGNAVVVGSITGTTGAHGASAYSAAKAGLVGLVRSAALEWASKGVLVNLLELGYTDAGMGARLPEKVKERVLATIPMRRFGTASDVVAAIDHLARTRYMSGDVLTLAGGLH